jgi:hypothetical protein
MKKLLACTAALLLLLGTQTSFADHRDRWDRHDNGRGWAHGRHDRDRWERRDRDFRDHVSVNLSFGHVLPDWRYRDYHRATSGVGISYTTTWGPPSNVYRYDSRPVIVHQNTYINEAPRTRVVTRSGRGRTSLFRDITGRCFEREIDGRGNETRTELPASACNF